VLIRLKFYSLFSSLLLSSESYFWAAALATKTRVLRQSLLSTADFEAALPIKRDGPEWSSLYLWRNAWSFFWSYFCFKWHLTFPFEFIEPATNTSEVVWDYHFCQPNSKRNLWPTTKKQATLHRFFSPCCCFWAVLELAEKPSWVSWVNFHRCFPPSYR